MPYKCLLLLTITVITIIINIRDNGLVQKALYILATLHHSSVTILQPINLWAISHVGGLLPITQWDRFEMCRQSSG